MSKLTTRQRRELNACELLAIEVTRDSKGWTARVHQEDVTLHQTPYYPEAEGAFNSAEYEFNRIVHERV
ncbi:MAG TPA: hypothetical protein VFP15_13475 [Gemmatimonadaceae bacterium]|nr:hypothetical protein [Gemmatimonadaceae bacterium]